jgi:hypothetical protein
MSDVVIASLPYVETEEPLMAPALLKGIVKEAGLSCYTFDFNAEVLHSMKHYPDDVKSRLEEWFLYKEHLQDPDVKDSINKLANDVADKIVQKNPKFICLSLFCHTAQMFTAHLCKILKKERNHPAKIIIGGNAVFTDENSNRPYAKILKNAKLIDHYIIGDGEEPLYNLLTNQGTEGVDEAKFQVLQDINQQPISDYDDFDWSMYPKQRLPMYASRGCVRRCTFCDVYKLWKKFKLRTAQIVFDEMVYQVKKTGITDFYFRDSLINGSISQFRELLTLIAEYNKTSEQKMSWTSFFIFRPENQMPESDWKLIADSGGYDMVIGVESLVDDIRYHMRKKFTNKDIDYGLKMAKKYNISMVFLLIIGYVTETDEDFQSALDWLDEHTEYIGMPLKTLAVGGTLTVTDLTDLYQHAEDFDIKIGSTIHTWENVTIGLDYATREKRKDHFIKYARQLGYNVAGHDRPVS